MCWGLLDFDRNDFSTFLCYEGGSDSIFCQTAADGQTIMIATTTTSASGRVLELAKWYHFAVTHAGAGAGNLKLYVNGQLDASVAGLSIPSFGTALNFYVGNSQFAEWLAGRVAAVKQWDAVLTQDQVQKEMFSFEPMLTSGLTNWTPAISKIEGAKDHMSGLTVNRDWTIGGGPLHHQGPPLPIVSFDPRSLPSWVFWAPPAAAPAGGHPAVRRLGGVVHGREAIGAGGVRTF
jgi:hypothetical protein